jgi:predicted HD phosphohydrolase
MADPAARREPALARWRPAWPDALVKEMLKKNIENPSSRRLLRPMTGGPSRFPVVLARHPATRDALAYAAERHAGQRRKSDGAPFIEHPLEVAWLLYRAGAPDAVIAAGVLHDTIEKAGADRAELSERFGARTAEIVAAVSEDASIRPYARRKAALRAQVAGAWPEALSVFAADMISKVREYSLGHRASLPSERRLAHYRRCVELLEQVLGDSPLVLQLRAEFDRLVQAPALQPAFAG